MENIVVMIMVVGHCGSLKLRWFQIVSVAGDCDNWRML